MSLAKERSLAGHSQTCALSLSRGSSSALGPRGVGTSAVPTASALPAFLQARLGSCSSSAPLCWAASLLSSAPLGWAAPPDGLPGWGA